MADRLGLNIKTVSSQPSTLERECLFLLEDNRVVHVPDFASLLAGADDDADGASWLA